MNPERLGLFAKYWEPGQVKTRLAESIGLQQAADVHRALTECSASRFRAISCRHVLAFAPETNAARDGFDCPAYAGWDLVPQVGGNLGARMQAFLSAQFSSGATSVVILGADSPHLPLDRIQDAFRLLQTREVVLGPSEDGGYYLLGASRKVAPIFEGIPWGTQHVWQATVHRLNAAGIPYETLRPWYDIDRSEDLDRLLDDLKQTDDEHLVTLRRQLLDVVND